MYDDQKVTLFALGELFAAFSVAIVLFAIL